MKISHQTQRQDGSAVIVFTILLAIMVILMMAESRSLAQLRQEEKFLEQQQIKRLNLSQSNTNAVTVAATFPAAK